MIIHRFKHLYRFAILGFAAWVVAVAPAMQAQTQTPPNASQTPAEPTLKPADEIPEVFTPQVPEIEQDTIQLQEQLQQDQVPSQEPQNQPVDQLHQINLEEQQIEQNEQDQRNPANEPSPTPSPSNP